MQNIYIYTSIYVNVKVYIYPYIFSSHMPEGSNNLNLFYKELNYNLMNDLHRTMHLDLLLLII